MEYPYLGLKGYGDEFETIEIENSPYKMPKKYIIVMFTSENKGVVLSDNYTNNGELYGKNDNFNEDEFDFLHDLINVTIHN